MKILCTGGSGFIGSHLAEKFLTEGDDVVVIDNLSTGNIQNLKSCFLHPNFTFVKGDILDRFTMDSLISECDTVFHFAALVGMKLATRSFWDIYQNNIEGTKNVIELANKYRKKVFLASTSEIYGMADGVFSENGSVMLGVPSKKRWAYAYSKIMDELLAFSYIEKYGLPITIFRFFNVIGPKQTGIYGMVIPTFIKAALKNEPITVYGSGGQIRSFTYISDIIGGIFEIYRTGKLEGEAINIGSTENITILGLANKIKKLTNSDSNIEYFSYESVYGEGFEDVMDRIPDLTKIENAINYKPLVDLDTAIKFIASHEKENNLYIP